MTQKLMQRRGWLCRVLAWLAGVTQALPLSAQHGISVSPKSVRLFTALQSDGIAWFDTWVEGLPGSDFSESVYGDFSVVDRGDHRTVLERFVRDNFRHVYISYSIIIERLPDALRVAFSGPNEPPPDALPPKENWTVTVPGSYPVPQIVHWGDEILVHLYKRDENVELVDYIQFALKDKVEPRQSAPHDSYAEDAEFKLTKPRLRVNGIPQGSISLPETLQAGVIWVYAPGFGRYVLSYSPHPDFGLDKVGEVTGTHLTFEVAGDLFRLECADRIAPGGGVYNVYGLRDANWEPADPKDHDRFTLGTSPSLETATGR